MNGKTTKESQGQGRSAAVKEGDLAKRCGCFGCVSREPALSERLFVDRTGTVHSATQPTQPRQSNAFLHTLIGNGDEKIRLPRLSTCELHKYENDSRLSPPSVSPSASPSAPACRLSRIPCSAASILAATAPVWILPNQAAAACAGAQNHLTLTSQSQACQIGGLWASENSVLLLLSKKTPGRSVHFFVDTCQVGGTVLSQDAKRSDGTWEKH